MSSSNIKIRKGTKEDLPVLLRLIRELALYEKAPDEVSNTLEDMEEDGFGKQPVFKFIVAEVGNEISGIALYFIKYSTWKGKGIYLDDLIVTEKHRRKGIGKLLFQQVIEEAKKINARQLHWQVLNWNTPAIEFYKKYNASLDDEWINCKLNEEQINLWAH